MKQAYLNHLWPPQAANRLLRSITQLTPCKVMKILPLDGSGATSRQLATILSNKGHRLHVLWPQGLTLAKLTRCVKKAHKVPSFGPDPYKWLDAALGVLRREHFDVLICAQEQVAVLSSEVQHVRDLRVRIAALDSSALSRVMDKISPCESLRKLGFFNPRLSLSELTVEELLSHSHLATAYVKTQVGALSAGVRFPGSTEDLAVIASQHDRDGSFSNSGTLIVQREISGDVLMVTAVCQRGSLLSRHACLKARDGPNGGATKKCSLPLASVGDDLGRLGCELKWDEALSMDAIFVASEQKAYYVDVNPRIVEPMDALFSGVDLVEHLLQISQQQIFQLHTRRLRRWEELGSVPIRPFWRC